jgi:hypothetical protein
LSESNFKWYFKNIPFSNGVLADPMNEERRLLRAHTFDEIAELYDQGRRECPDFLIDGLFSLAR